VHDKNINFCRSHARSAEPSHGVKHTLALWPKQAALAKSESHQKVYEATSNLMATSSQTREESLSKENVRLTSG